MCKFTYQQHQAYRRSLIHIHLLAQWAQRQDGRPDCCRYVVNEGCHCVIFQQVLQVEPDAHPRRLEEHWCWVEAQRSLQSKLASARWLSPVLSGSMAVNW